MKLLAKTVKITNRRNVLVQIPGFVIAAWQGADELEVYYDQEEGTVTIKPTILGRGLFAESGAKMA